METILIGLLVEWLVKEGLPEAAKQLASSTIEAGINYLGTILTPAKIEAGLAYLLTHGHSEPEAASFIDRIRAAQGLVDPMKAKGEPNQGSAGPSVLDQIAGNKP